VREWAGGIHVGLSNWSLGGRADDAEPGSSFSFALMATTDGTNFVRTRACRCGDSPVTCIDDEEPLTQYAASPTSVRIQPREVLQNGTRELSMSLLRGRLSVIECFRHVVGRLPTPTERQKVMARYTDAGSLRRVGFAVVHTPTRALKIHVSVVWPDVDPLDRQDTPWPDGVPERFNECFTELSGAVEGGE